MEKKLSKLDPLWRNFLDPRMLYDGFDNLTIDFVSVIPIPIQPSV